MLKGARVRQRRTSRGQALGVRGRVDIGGVVMWRKVESGVASLLAPAFYGGGGGAAATPLSS